MKSIKNCVWTVFAFGLVACLVGACLCTKALAKERDNIMQIAVNANGNTIVFELNDSRAAKDLFAQLPLETAVENYSSNEKIYYPPEKLETLNTPLVQSAQSGTLAYYAPWGDVVMFYGNFGSASGLYELGHAVKGGEHIRSLSGTIRIEVSHAH
ncbi:cyclophilin-like fold protein [uncultured Pseudodesulfovibrio sp.]|uniref:cyclophilin-like fold protein n=1 Tax=uncultured Pseudodesulfovibrio sp. TaxID=2035858 RepID=UPI0029C687D4|nr:cyclophilin-like fold protein [uncultured Pseudodesulfovibrio sp.]